MDEGRARLDARLPPQVVPGLPEAAHAQLGRRHVGDLLRRHLLLHQAHQLGRSTSWDELPDAIKNTYEKLGIPEAERKYLAGVTAQYESEVVFHRNREDLERKGVIFCDMDTALREYPGARQAVLGQDHPGQRQQVLRPQLLRVVGWLVHLRAAGRRGRDAAAGLLPHQRGEHGPVRAHADHRRRGLEGALHRGLLGPRVHHRLAALGRGRDRREAVGPGHLHDHPELVEQRLQPRHQAGPGRGRGPHGVDRRQHRQPPHDEVPGRLHGRPQGLRRGALGRLRRRGPAPGRRRQDGPRRAGDHLEDRVEVDLQGRRPHQLPRPRPGRGRRLRLQEPRAVRRPHPRRPLHQRHLPLHGGRARATP